MPKKAGGSGDSEDVLASEAISEAIPAREPEPAAKAAASGPLPAFQLPGSDFGGNDFGGNDFGGSGAAASSAAPAAEPKPKAPAFATPRPLSEVSFDDAKPSASTFPGRTAPEQNAPSFTAPKSLSDTSFDDILPSEAPRQTPPQSPAPGFAVGAGSAGAAGGQPAPAPLPGVGGMGISITGAGLPAAPKQTPAQLSAGSQSLRIRLLRPDGKPFDGPEITTGPKQPEAPQTPARTGFDASRGPKKQAPKVVVKTGPMERAGHTAAVLLISAIGIVPLAYLLMQSVHDRENKLASRITVPTKMNVLDSTSEAYLGGMVVVLLVVTVLYMSRLRRRRAR